MNCIMVNCFMFFKLMEFFIWFVVRSMSFNLFDNFIIFESGDDLFNSCLCMCDIC